MVDQLIQMAAWKGMQQKNFPLWTLLNAYNQQPARLMEMSQTGFFPSEQGPIPLHPQQAVVTQPTQTVQPVDNTVLTELTAEVKDLKDEIASLVSHSKRQHARISDVEKAVIQQSPPPNPTP